MGREGGTHQSKSPLLTITDTVLSIDLTPKRSNAGGETKVAIPVASSWKAGQTAVLKRRGSTDDVAAEDTNRSKDSDDRQPESHGSSAAAAHLTLRMTGSKEIMGAAPPQPTTFLHRRAQQRLNSGYRAKRTARLVKYECLIKPKPRGKTSHGPWALQLIWRALLNPVINSTITTSLSLTGLHLVSIGRQRR